MQPARFIGLLIPLFLIGCNSEKKADTPKKSLHLQGSVDSNEHSQHTSTRNELIVGASDPHLMVLEPSGRLDTESEHGPMGMPQLPNPSCTDEGEIWCVERVARRMRFETARSEATVVQEFRLSSVKQESEED